MSIADNFHTITQRIQACEQACTRERGSVALLVVTKRQSVACIREVIQCGQRSFGESVVQEAIPKIQALQDESLVWHMIGPLQSNKARFVAEYFDWVHGVDRLKIAERLHHYRSSSQPKLNICVQVNISGETQKQGIAPADVLQFTDALAPYDRLCVRGLMTIPRPSTDVAEQKRMYGQLHALYQSMHQEVTHWDTLSMGMSGDFESAIWAGSTMVRIGRAVFSGKD